MPGRRGLADRARRARRMRICCSTGTAAGGAWSTCPPSCAVNGSTPEFGAIRGQKLCFAGPFRDGFAVGPQARDVSLDGLDRSRPALSAASSEKEAVWRDQRSRTGELPGRDS